MAAPDRREVVRIRRMAIVECFFMALLLYGFLHMLAGGFTEPLNAKPYSFLFGSMVSWPAFFRSFWLLDFLSVWLYSGLAMYVLFRLTIQRSYDRHDKLLAALRIVIATCGVGGLFGTLFNGWYGGIEGFFLGGPTLLTAFSIWGGFIFGGVYGLAGLGRLIARGWRKFAPSGSGLWLQPVRDYFDAKDVPSSSVSDK